jgi:AcrR family transcriptional regulator
MIYYYFGSKDGLYLAVLEQVYSDPAVSSRSSILPASRPCGQ